MDTVYEKFSDRDMGETVLILREQSSFLAVELLDESPDSRHVLCEYLCINFFVLHSGHDCFPILKESANGV